MIIYIFDFYIYHITKNQNHFVYPEPGSRLDSSLCSFVLNAERNDDAVWEALMEKAIEIASDYGIDPSSPRTAGRQQHHNDVPTHTPSAYWKRAMYLSFLDHLVTEINEKLVVPLPGFQAQLLIPGNDIVLATIIFGSCSFDHSVV